MKTWKENLEEGTKKFEKCEHNFKGLQCSLNGYPIIDCPACKSYKERSVENVGKPRMERNINI